MPHVKFTNEYRHREGAAAERVYPKGWEGEVSAEVAAAARKAGAVAKAAQKSEAKADGNKQG